MTIGDVNILRPGDLAIVYRSHCGCSASILFIGAILTVKEYQPALARYCNACLRTFESLDVWRTDHGTGTGTCFAASELKKIRPLAELETRQASQEVTLRDPIYSVVP